MYRAAKNSSALLSFNLAILLEDLNREEEAIVAYREALAQDPSLHDAHFNLSRLHEKTRQPKDALRHLLAYRKACLAARQFIASIRRGINSAPWVHNAGRAI